MELFGKYLLCEKRNLKVLCKKRGVDYKNSHWHFYLFFIENINLKYIFKANKNIADETDLSETLIKQLKKDFEKIGLIKIRKTKGCLDIMRFRRAIKRSRVGECEKSKDGTQPPRQNLPKLVKKDKFTQAESKNLLSQIPTTNTHEINNKKDEVRINEIDPLLLSKIYDYKVTKKQFINYILPDIAYIENLNDYIQEKIEQLEYLLSIKFEKSLNTGYFLFNTLRHDISERVYLRHKEGFKYCIERNISEFSESDYNTGKEILMGFLEKIK